MRTDRFPSILLRADASLEMGAGHVTRLVALGEAQRRLGGDAVLATRASNVIVDRIRKSGFFVHKVEAGAWTEEVAELDTIRRAKGVSVIVVDGYQFPDSYYRQLRSVFPYIVAIDDLCNEHICADIVVNQNVGASLSVYPRATMALVGPKYIMLREQFLSHSHVAKTRRSGARLRVLLSFGGSDPLGQTPRVLRLFPKEPCLDIVAVLGHAYQEEGQLVASIQIAKSRGHTVNVKDRVANMAEMMGAADVAIGAAGTTMWELAYMFCPCAAYVIAENQVANASWLRDRGCIWGGDWITDKTDHQLSQELCMFLSQTARRNNLAKKFHTMVDGLGANRVVQAIADTVSTGRT